MLPIKSCYIGIIVLATCSMLAQCALEPTATESFGPDNTEDKSDDTTLTVHKRPSFFVGSRYGRSGQKSPIYASSKMRRLNVVPRNDRFFLGSRYGKRAEQFIAPLYDENSGNAPFNQNDKLLSPTDTNIPPYLMSCTFTGVRNLYRCNNMDELNNIMNQLTTAQVEDERN